MHKINDILVLSIKFLKEYFKIKSVFVAETIWSSPSIVNLSLLKVFASSSGLISVLTYSFCSRLFPFDLTNFERAYFFLRLTWIYFRSNLVGTEGWDGGNKTRGDGQNACSNLKTN